MIKGSYLATAILALPLAFSSSATAQTPANKPNIVMIMADDVGIWNISAYHRGMMGGSTPTSTASPEREPSLRIITPSNPARQAEPPSSPGKRRSAPDS